MLVLDARNEKGKRRPTFTALAVFGFPLVKYVIYSFSYTLLFILVITVPFSLEMSFLTPKSNNKIGGIK